MKKKEFFDSHISSLIRLLFLLGIADQAWPDGTDLECDTNTPGCEMMCVNHFYPIAPLTFWKMQDSGSKKYK